MSKSIKYQFNNPVIINPQFETNDRLLSETKKGEFPFNNFYFQRNKNFTGREERLNEIHRNFTTGNTVSITQTIKGLGGIGKTAIAKEYAFCYADSYDYIWWIDAEKESDIQKSYEQFAISEQIAKTNDDLDVITRKVKYWLETHQRWLFIFDNVEEEGKEILQNKYLPFRNAGHILITSRYKHWSDMSTTIDIDLFSEEDACKFLNCYTGLTSDIGLKELVKKLEYYPLALEQAAAYIKENNISYQEYLELFSRYTSLFIKHKGIKNKTIYTTFKISIKKIKNPIAKKILNLCAFLSPDNIQLQWFRKYSQILFPIPLCDKITDNYSFNEIKHELEKYSLVSIENDCISLHRLLQSVVLFDISEKKQLELRNSCIKMLNTYVSDEFHDNDGSYDFSSSIDLRSKFLSIVPHVSSLTTKKEKEEDNELATLFFFLGDGYRELGNYHLAEKWYGKSLNILEKLPKNQINKEQLANIYNNNAIVYSRQGNHQTALDFYVKATSHFVDIYGNNHFETAMVYHNWGKVYQRMGDSENALKLFFKALPIRESHYGEDHIYTASTCMNIGVSYSNLDNQKEAFIWYNKALKVFEKTPLHPYLADAYCAMADTYLKIRDDVKALIFCQKALDIDILTHKEHPNTARSYVAKANILYKQKDYSTALELYQNAFDIRKIALGEENPETKEVEQSIIECKKNMLE